MEQDSGPFAATVEKIAQIGISIEPLDQVLQAQEAHNFKNRAALTPYQSIPSNSYVAHRLLESVSLNWCWYGFTCIALQLLDIFCDYRDSSWIDELIASNHYQSITYG